MFRKKMHTYIYASRRIIRSLWAALSSIGGKKQLGPSYSLRSFLRYNVQGSYEITYDNYAAENALFGNEIMDAEAEARALRHEVDYDRYVAQFEETYARAVGVAHARGVSSGTTALVFALRALGIGPGDEVLTTPHTFIATALAIIEVGARPVFVDTDAFYVMDPCRIAAAISSKTKAIIPVHLYGFPCDMEAIMHIAQKHRLYVIEDACQAHGAAIDGKQVGTWGHIGCFSFHPSKIIGGVGDGGILVTNDANIARRVEHFREVRFNDHFKDISFRTPARLAPVHIPFLTVKLKHLPAIIARRKTIAARYTHALRSIPEIALPQERNGYASSYRNYTIQMAQRDEFVRWLFAKGIQAKVFYPIAVHLARELGVYGYAPGSLPVAEAAHARIVSLPVSHALSDEQVEIIIAAVLAFFKH